MAKPLVVITGGQRGLGLALTRTFASNGFSVLATSRSTDPASGPALPRHVIPGTLDLQQPDSLSRFIEQVLSLCPNRIVLINNAGQGLLRSCLESSDDEIHKVFQTNFHGPFKLIQGLMPLLKDGGTIINILSVLSFRPVLNYGIYSASKGAFSNACTALQDELSAPKVNILNVFPGPIATDFDQNSLGDSALIAASKKGGITPDKLAQKIFRHYRSHGSGNLYSSPSVHALAIINALSISLASRILRSIR